MKKKTKKIIAIICAIAMVVSSMTITGINKVEAAEPNWSTLGYLGNGGVDTKYNNKYKGAADNGITVNNMQKNRNYDCVHIILPSAVNISSSLSSDAYHTEGAGFFLHLNSLTKKVTEFTITCGGVTRTVWMYYENGTTGGSSESSSVVTTTSGEVTYNWTTIGDDTGRWNNIFAYDTTSRSGFDVYGTVQNFNQVDSIYLAMKTDVINSFTINGVDAVKGTHYQTNAAQLYLSVSALTQEINTIEISYGRNQGTAKIIIKKDTTTVETTTKEPTVADKIFTEDNLVKTTSTVVASSEAEAAFGVGYIHDRDANTRWAAGRVDNQTVAGEYVYVDLGTTYSISSVVTLWNYLPTDGYKIYYATDLTGDTTTRGTVDTNVWTAATAAITTDTTSSDGNEHTLTDVVARYIMIYALSGTADWGISLYELGVFGMEVTAPSPVTSVNAAGGVRKIDVTWTNPADAAEGTQYYVYLDDEATERTRVNTNSATLTDVSVGPHIVKVKAYYDGVFSTVAESAQTQVVGSGVANLAVSSTKPNTVQVQWSNEEDATYQLELVNSEGTTVSTINNEDITVDGTLRKYEFTGVTKGTYTIKVTVSYAGTAMDPVVSDEVTVEDVQPVNLASLDANVETAEQIALTWTVNNPTEGQTYKVYLDSNEAIAVGTNTYTYLLENVSAGSHTVKVTAVYGEYETEGKTIQVTVKAKPVIKFETELAQVDTTSGTVKVDDTWSYEFANQSADAMFAVDKNNAFIAYLPTYAGAALDKVYETVTGLEIGKTYTYTYRVDTDVAGNNIPVVASMENGDSDSYELTAITTDGVSVTKKFTATATTMQLAYTLGFVKNAAAVKISKATITKLQPTDITGLTAKGGIETINLSWICDDAVEEQAYNIYLDGNATPIASGVLTKTYTLEGVAKGTHSVTVKAILNGVETSGMTVENITVTKVEVAITSDSITVEGFQIKTNNPENTVGFRTICKAPNKGSQIVASDDVTYTVESMGTIYTLDPNTDGYRKNDVLNASYTILNPTPVSEKSYSYVGASLYNDAQRTYGYLATENAIVTSWNPSDTTNTYYVRTMLGMSEYTMLENSIHVRAFVVATDGTIIYSKKTACISVAEVADHLYKNSKSNNYTAHKYLYSSILNKVSNTNPYYRDATLPYGWDSQLFTPSNPTFTLTYGT